MEGILSQHGSIVRLLLNTVIVIVFFLIYRVRDLYQQHLKYQRLQRDEAEVS